MNKIIFILALALSSFHVYSASQFKLIINKKNVKNIKSSDLRRVQALITRAQRKLPLKLKETINRPINIYFTLLNDGKFITSKDLCSTKKSLGRVKRKRRGSINHLLLDASFFNLMAERSNKKCGNRSIAEILEGTIIHEVSHIFDFEAGSPSNSAYFKNITNWQQKGFIIKRNHQKNHFHHASPDAYEFTNIQETFATNFEYYIQDPEFSCRRPHLGAYFKGLFKERKRGVKCNRTDFLNIPGGVIKKNELGFTPIQFENLYSIDYLLAAKGPKMMSRWGHSMIRFVFCRPGRKLGEDCRKDLKYHVVGTFAADVTDLSINMMKGIIGGYDSVISMKSFYSIQSKYTEGEYRDLESYPLKINRSQLYSLYLRLLDLHWSYKGDYKFFSNNCADETLDTFKVLLPTNKHFLLKGVTTPKGLLRILKKEKLIALQDIKKKNAEELSYFIPSFKMTLNQVVENLIPTDSTDKLLKKSLKDSVFYADELSARDRLDLIKNRNTQEALTIQELALIAQVEKHIERKFKAKNMQKLSSKIKDFMEENPTHRTSKRVGEYLKGGELIKDLGYGIPLESSIAQAIKAQRRQSLKVVKKNDKQDGYAQMFQALIKKFKVDQHWTSLEIKDIQENIDYINQELETIIFAM